MDRDTLDEGGGLGSLAAEEAAMRRGKGRMLAAMWGTVLVVIALFAWVMLREDDSRLYRELGKQINGLERMHFQGFWGCALEGFKLADLKSNEDLMAQIDRRGMQGRRKYGVHVRDRCLENLREMQPALDTLLPPEDLQGPLGDMDKALTALRGSWTAYIAYLETEGLEYDSASARPLLTEVARGWYDFRHAHSAVNKVLKARLE